MAKKPETQATAQPSALRMAWKVLKTPPGEATLKVGGVRAGVNGILQLTQDQADTLNKAIPGCVTLQGI